MYGDVGQHHRACFHNDDAIRLVQDHERCLWQDRCMKALRLAGCHALQIYPKHSPDFDAIEGWWRVLRDRLEMTALEEMETRAQFLFRLRSTVRWLNEHMRDNALLLSRNQKARAADVLKLEGARTKW